MSGEVQMINGKRVASPEYRSWQMMKNRVTNPNAQDARYYMGLGMEPRWADFQEFLKDMGRRPSPNRTLDRIDGTKGYFADNCRWATQEEQSRNRPGYNKLTIEVADEIREAYAAGGVTQVDLAKSYGITQAQVSQIVRNLCWKK